MVRFYKVNEKKKRVRVLEGPNWGIIQKAFDGAFDEVGLGIKFEESEQVA